MDRRKYGVPRPGDFARDTVPTGEWKSIDFEAAATDRRPRETEPGSSSSEEEKRPMEMTAGGNDIAALVAALKEHTRAIGSLVATLAPPVPDLVGTDYIARRLGVSKQWVGAMAERGDIPRHCVAPKVSGGRIWKFHRDKIEAWLRDREEG
jgi:hypothetical protein